MRSRFAGLSSSSRVAGSTSIAPPPSYASVSQHERDTGSIASWRSNSPEAEMQREVTQSSPTPTLTSTPIPSVVAMEAPAIGRNQTASRFLKINYDGKSVLIVRPEQFEDIIETVREMFSLPDNTPLFASADVPSFDNERMLLHRGVWPIISSDISVVWISESADLGSVNRSAIGSVVVRTATDSLVVRTSQPEDAPPGRAGLRRVKVFLYQHDMNIFVVIKDGATIRELRAKIIQVARDHSIYISKLDLKNITAMDDRVLRGNELASADIYYGIQIHEYLTPREIKAKVSRPGFGFGFR